MKKTETFKYVIKEFHESQFPTLIQRELRIPKTNKITSLIGSRRSGKTFYFYQIMNELLDMGIPKDRLLYINFEDDRLLPLDTDQLNDMLDAYYELYPNNKNAEKFFFFDEIQNIENWEVFVRRVYDKENARIYVTGSSSKLLSKEIATSLRGRTLAFRLFPLSFREFLAFKGLSIPKDFAYSELRFKIKNLLNEYLDFGGFPEVVLDKELKRDILLNYFELLIYRDLAERFSIRNTMILRRLTKFLLTNISSPFSINAYYKALKQETRVSKETIMEYLSYLTEINLIYLVPFFSYSLKVQQVNPSKVYCTDNGLRNAVALKFSADEGRLAENTVFIELKRRGYDVHYWKGRKEVDFVVKDKNGRLTAINASYTNEVNSRELDGLLEFKEKFSADTQELLILTKDFDDTRDGIKFVPLWKWLLGMPKEKEEHKSE
ncbi:MAG: ATP-binding protein [Candidatus Aenigmarchaeota archaeon]|nr:ATP-binding protein [Candidatus Aenigmarchaeota archaeon]